MEHVLLGLEQVPQRAHHCLVAHGAPEGFVVISVNQHVRVDECVVVDVRLRIQQHACAVTVMSGHGCTTVLAVTSTAATCGALSSLKAQQLPAFTAMCMDSGQGSFLHTSSDAMGEGSSSWTTCCSATVVTTIPWAAAATQRGIAVTASLMRGNSLAAMQVLAVPASFAVAAPSQSIVEVTIEGASEAGSTPHGAASIVVAVALGPAQLPAACLSMRSAKLPAMRTCKPMITEGAFVTVMSPMMSHAQRQ